MQNDSMCDVLKSYTYINSFSVIWETTDDSDSGFDFEKSEVARGIRNEPRHEKTNVLVSDQVRHKPDCAATEDG